MPPKTIAGRYEVEEEIGRGGMGAVWLCRDNVLGRRVAVKQLGGLPGETAPAIARALREARASAALNHPHVVAIYDAVESGDHVWLVMEHVPSRTLSAILAAEGRLDAPRAAAICAQVADGLAVAHAHGTIHRDVKPSNILVGEDDHTKLSDFGIARHVDDETLTESGMVTGTPLYFSPQLARGAAPTPADDVWALGATLFSAVEGHPPWPAQQNPLALLVHITENDPPSPEAAGPLAPLIERMMSAEPDRRPPMATVADELRAIAAGGLDQVTEEPSTIAFAAQAPADPPTMDEAPAAPTPTVRRPAPVEKPHRRRVFPLVAAAAVVVLIALVGAALLLANRQQDDGPASGERGGRTAAAGSAGSGGAGAASTEPTTTAPTEGSTDPTTPEATTSAAPSTDPAQFVTDYYSLLPADTRSAWDLLSDDMQSQVGNYGSYRGFWDTVDSVTVDDTSESSSGTVTVDLTYESDRGTESETRLITVADTGDGMQIVDDQVD